MPARFAALLCLLLTACAVTPPRPPTDPAAVRCLTLRQALERTVADQGYSPSSPARIEGFPYLRVNRFLADFRAQPMTAEERAAWVGRLAEIDQEARRVELASLAPSVRDDLARRYAAPLTLESALSACSSRLQAVDLADADRFAALRRQAVAPPDYSGWKRLAGLYPVSSLPVSSGVARWHAEVHDTFAQPLAALPLQGRLRRFRPPDAIEPPPSFELIRRDALGIPEPDAGQLAALFAAYAPVWEIDVAGGYDLPGAPYWRSGGVPDVDARRPVSYRYLSYTRWRKQPALQLNYVIWFSERPAKGPLDILAGALDGLVWRVTLDQRGRPLLYDSIHPCGCYHQFFPTAALRLRLSAVELPEPPLVPQAAPPLAPGQRIVVRLGSGDHYIQRLYADVPAGTVYGWENYAALYAIPAGDHRRSLFGPDGLTPGAERAERWLLWPMGVASPGAMRERGRQAVAFVGRRHFDDPDLLYTLFEPVEIR